MEHEQFVEVATDLVIHEMELKLKAKQMLRCPGVIVPKSLTPLPLTDKDGNTIHNMIVYKNQIDDAIKAIRRGGYTARMFAYNQQKFNDE